MSTPQKVLVGKTWRGQKTRTGMLKINGSFSTYNYIKVSGEDESVLLIKDGIFVEPSMILSDNITGTVDQMHVLKDDTDIVELYDGSHKCIACSTIITADPMDVADVLITHKLLCRQLQKMYSAEKEKESSEGNSELRPADAKRKLILEADDLTGAVEPDVVYCKPCEKWIRLVGNIFNASNWLVHRSRRHTEIGNCNTTQNQESSNGIPAPAHTKVHIRSEMENRRRTLESDHLLGVVEAHRVWCRKCKKFIALSGGAYRPYHWQLHRDRLHPSVNESLEKGRLDKEDSDETYITSSSETDRKGSTVQTRSSKRHSNITSSASSRTRRVSFQDSKKPHPKDEHPENSERIHRIEVVPPTQTDKPLPASTIPERPLTGQKRSQADGGNDATQAGPKNRKTRHESDAAFPSIPTDRRVRRVIWEFED